MADQIVAQEFEDSRRGCVAGPGVYAIRNIVDRKIYVGSALNVKRRLALHISQLQAGTHHSRELQAAWRAHGSEAFRCELLEAVTDPNNLLPREQYWIDGLGACRTGYNTQLTAQTPDARRRRPRAEFDREPANAAPRVPREGRGGFRGTQGRNTLFPGKDQKLTILVTATALDALRQTAARLTASKPRIASADTVDQVTISDAAEYLIRRGAGVPLED